MESLETNSNSNDSFRKDPVNGGYWILTGAIVLFALLTRFYQLDLKPLHHDESLFAYYSHFLFRGFGYDYQPILHGPVLEHVVALIFLVFGDSNFTMRLWSAVGGLLLLLVTWHWKRYIGRIGMVAAFALIALSPSLTYYSRFLRNDVPYLTVTCWCALCLVSLMHTGNARYAWGAILTFILAFSMMESSIFFLAACVGYIGVVTLADWLAGLFREGENRVVLEDGENPVAGEGAMPTESYILVALAALVLEMLVAWLFYRVLYGAIHIYKPFLTLLKPHFPWLTATMMNWGIVCLLYPVFFLFCLTAYANYRKPRGVNGTLHHFLHVWWSNRLAVVGAVCLGIAFYTMMFTTYFTKISGPEFNWQTKSFDGPVRAWTPVQIYKNTWDYWWDQHKLHRIKGPFHYYLPILLNYELPALLLLVAGWWRSLRRSPRFWMHIGIAVGVQVLFGLFYYIFSDRVDWAWMDRKFHVSHAAHLFIILFYCQLLTHLTGYLFLTGRRVESFLTFWMVTSLFAYSYAGEKVPWLAVHVVGPLCLLAGLYVQRFWVEINWTAQRRLFTWTAIAVLGIWQLRTNLILNFVNSSSPTERLVYNHTAPDLELAVKQVDQIAHDTLLGKELPMYIKGEMEWPLNWYLRDYTNALGITGEDENTTTRPVVMVDWEKSQVPNLTQNYRIQRLKLREWWEPPMLKIVSLAEIYRGLTPKESRDPTTLNGRRYSLALYEWRKLLHYLLYREIWIDPFNPDWSNGANEIAFCVRLDLEEEYLSPQALDALGKRRDIPRYP